MSLVVSPQNSYVEVLTPSTSECDCIWRQDLFFLNIYLFSLRWVLVAARGIFVVACGIFSCGIPTS